MGKVYIGVMAVGGHKFWGGWQEGWGVGWFGGMGGRWKMDGRLWGGLLAGRLGRVWVAEW